MSFSGCDVCPDFPGLVIISCNLTRHSFGSYSSKGHSYSDIATGKQENMHELEIMELDSRARTLKGAVQAPPN